MAEKKELGLPKTTVNSKEQLARSILKYLRLQGHTYIELRQDGKRFVFFCILCIAPCYSETILHQHLKGKIHTGRVVCARTTLVGKNPWPFSDGLHFFDTSTGEEKEKTPISGGKGVPGQSQHCGVYNRTSVSDGGCQPAAVPDDEPSHCADNRIISGVLINKRTLDVEAKFIGFGLIAARLFETKGRTTWIDKIWCEWLGCESLSDEYKAMVPEHDFAIVTFSYFQPGMLVDPSRFLTSSLSAESGIGEENCRKRMRSFLDPGDSRMSKRARKNKRREQRREQKIFNEKRCVVCQQKFLPGKDVAAILNLKTGKLVCGSRNLGGAFHLFHVSCVVHWFLFCESEITANKMLNEKVKWSRLTDHVIWQIFSVFCPECQGTGINIEGGVREKDTFQLSLTWMFYVKMALARKAWLENHEKLENCSTGFHFPQEPDESGQVPVPVQEERVEMMKLVRFYRMEF